MTTVQLTQGFGSGLKWVPKPCQEGEGGTGAGTGEGGDGSGLWLSVSPLTSPFYPLLPWCDVATGQRPHRCPLPPKSWTFSLQNCELNNCFYEVLRLKCFILSTQNGNPKNQHAEQKERKKIKQEESVDSVAEKEGMKGGEKGGEHFPNPPLHWRRFCFDMWNLIRTETLSFRLVFIVLYTPCDVFSWMQFSHSNSLSFSTCASRESHTPG